MVHVFVAGCGVVGKEVLKQLSKVQKQSVEKYGFRLQLAGVSDSSGLCVASKDDGRGGHHGELNPLDVWNWKQSGNKVSEFPGGSKASGWDSIEKKKAIFVDCTATESTVPLIKTFLSHGGGIILANKKPVTQSMHDWEFMFSAQNYARVYYESTAGAGTPFVASLLRVVQSGDTVRSIRGAFSGTLGFLATGIQEGKALSSLVKEAKELGYTEPDPRDDLSGMDVARKALILARTLGWKLEMKDVHVEALFPKHMESLTVDQFLDALRSTDAEMMDRHIEAQKNNCVLRYIATIEGGKCDVGLRAVPSSSPLGLLRGTDNIMQLTSDIYESRPLVIQGSGAGAAVTAAGVIADMISLAPHLSE